MFISSGQSCDPTNVLSTLLLQGTVCFLVLSCVLNRDLFTSKFYANSEGMKGKQPSRSLLV